MAISHDHIFMVMKSLCHDRDIMKDYGYGYYKVHSLPLVIALPKDNAVGIIGNE
jgi:hypothetical protein